VRWHPNCVRSLGSKQLAKRKLEIVQSGIIENPELAIPQNGQRLAVRTVFKETVESGSIVADCISGMTEKG
jgi:hypothetical protein